MIKSMHRFGLHAGARRVAAVVGTASIMGVIPALPAAHAEPADVPCDLVISMLCRFLPVAPQVDTDVDLSTQVPPADPSAPAPDYLPPADVCARGCVYAVAA
jgi:hypothetical protein